MYRTLTQQNSILSLILQYPFQYYNKKKFYIQTSAGCLQSLPVKILIPHCNTVKCHASAHIVPVVMLVETIKAKELAVSIKGRAFLGQLSACHRFTTDSAPPCLLAVICSTRSYFGFAVKFHNSAGQLKNILLPIS